MKYEFTKIDETVKMVPMGTLFCKRIMDRMRKELKGILEREKCYFNAMTVAWWLKKNGFEVELVDGEYAGSEYGYKKLSWAYKLNGMPMPNLPNYYNSECHRWLKKGDKYFDPTVELLLGAEQLKWFDYRAKRIFNYDTLDKFYDEIYDNYGALAIVGTIDGVMFNDGKPYFFGRIDDQGEFVKAETNPLELCPAFLN